MIEIQAPDVDTTSFDSNVVPHRSTNQARPCLTSLSGREQHSVTPSGPAMSISSEEESPPAKQMTTSASAALVDTASSFVSDSTPPTRQFSSRPLNPEFGSRSLYHPANSGAMSEQLHPRCYEVLLRYRLPSRQVRTLL
jgi:hypothetical protein